MNNRNAPRLYRYKYLYEAIVDYRGETPKALRVIETNVTATIDDKYYITTIRTIGERCCILRSRITIQEEKPTTGSGQYRHVIADGGKYYYLQETKTIIHGAVHNPADTEEDTKVKAVFRTILKKSEDPQVIGCLLRTWGESAAKERVLTLT